MKDVVIVSGVRLPVGSYGGNLKSISAIDMGAMVVKEAVNRAGIQPSDVDEVIIGQVGKWICSKSDQSESRHAKRNNCLFCKQTVRFFPSVHCRCCYGNPDWTG